MVDEQLFSDKPRNRIAAAGALDESARRAVLDRLAFDAPYKPWPRGMPGSVNPLLVVVGVSPGDSPAADQAAFLSDYTPTFGEPAAGFKYPDTSHYWQKVRLLSRELLRIWDSTLTEDECLALTSHLNLGTGMFGSASMAAIELEVVRWVSATILRFHARVVIGLGLIEFLTSPRRNDLRTAWNEGGLMVAWTVPNVLTRGAFRFRSFVARGIDERTIQVLLWPNHPSRVPFAGRGEIGGAWHRSVLAAAEFLRTCKFDPIGEFCGDPGGPHS